MLRLLVQAVLAFVRWVHQDLVARVVSFWLETVLGSWEEVTRAIVRQWFLEASRLVSGVATWVVSLFSSGYRSKLRAAWAQSSLPKWWSGVPRPSSLNAVIEQLRAPARADSASHGSGSATPATAQSPNKAAGAASGAVLRAASAPAPQDQQGQQRQPRARFRGWQKAAGTGPEPGLRTGRARQPPLPGAPFRPLLPSDVFLQPSGAGVIVRQRGLLEDAHITAELAVAKAFELFRRLVRLVFLLPSRDPNVPRPSPAAPCTAPPGGAAAAPGAEHSSRPTADRPCDGILMEETEDEIAAEEHLHVGPPAALSSSPAATTRVAAVSAPWPSSLSAQAHTLPPEPSQTRSWWRPWSWFRGPQDRQQRQHQGASGSSGRRAQAGWDSRRNVPRCHSMQTLRVSGGSSSSNGAATAQGRPDGPGPPAHTTAASSGRPYAESSNTAAASPSASGSSALSSSGASSSAAAGGVRRVHSFSRTEAVCQHMSEVSSASDVVRLAGYPLEQHTCTTADGYILTLERIPRVGCRDVVYFLHGALDTSMSWVSGGVTGSQAFAAWEAGFDVWLGNTRSNVPRLHRDPKRMSGTAYWRFNGNHVSIYDVGAMMDYIHNVKCAELGHGAHFDEAPRPGSAQGQPVSSHSHATTRPGASGLAQRAGSGFFTPPVHPTAGFLTPPMPPRQARPPATPDASGGTPPDVRRAATDSRSTLTRTASASGPLHSLYQSLLAAGVAAVGARRWEGAGAGQEGESPPSTQVVEDTRPLRPDSGSEPAGNGTDSQEETGGAAGGCDGPGGAAAAAAVAAAAARGAPGRGPRSSMEAERACACNSMNGGATAEWNAPAGRGGGCDACAAAAALGAADGTSGGVVRDTERQAGIGTAWHSGQQGQGQDAGPSSSGSAAAGRLRQRRRQGLGSGDCWKHLLQEQQQQADEAGRSQQQQQQQGGMGHLQQQQQQHQQHQPHQQQQQQHQQQQQYRQQGPTELYRQQGPTEPYRQQGPTEPYRLRAVAHSLGCMNLLIYCVLRGGGCAAQGSEGAQAQGSSGSRDGQGAPTAAAATPGSFSSSSSSHIHRLILLTPAGFHPKKPRAALLLQLFLPPAARLVRMVWPSFTMPFTLPTSIARSVVFKLVRDVYSIPSLLELVKIVIRVALNNDPSQWERALQMPHYNAFDMPAMSLDQILHLVQIAYSGRFQLFDYGSRSANLHAYGAAQPLDVGAQYSRLRSIPVNLVAGLRDGIIPPECTQCHYVKMKDAGVQVDYKEFDFGHLDFTFAVREDLQLYLLKLLRLPC